MTSAVGRVVLKSSFVGVASKRRDVARIRGARTNGARANAFFKNPLRQDSSSAGIVGSQGRDDYDRDDVEYYFNYMGILAVEGSNDRMDNLLASGMHPVDIILLFASAEGDTPKIEEILAAGADKTVKDLDGKSVAELAGRDNPDKRDAVLALLK
jgi:hypothetical protein|tara:strand:+ start:17755 stop:18219 length:465 start_codon:yes stop_codon:yes gene_type:complete